jgi:hypothetical protein
VILREIADWRDGEVSSEWSLPMKFPSCASQSFLDIQSCELQCTAALYRPHAILGSTVLLPIIKRIGDLRRGHDAMRPGVSHLHSVSPLWSFIVFAFAGCFASLRALKAYLQFRTSPAEYGLTKIPSSSTNRICTICSLTSCDPSPYALLPFPFHLVQSRVNFSAKRP